MSTHMVPLDESVTTGATATDYCKIFDEQMRSLYLLAFLLTADRDKAEQCFVGGLEECAKGSGACMEGDSWARRAIIRRAIQMIGPAQERGASGLFSDAPVALASNNPFAVIVSLCAFERFVLVMSVLEGQPDEDCESLLGCSRHEVVIARKIALRLFAAANPGYERGQGETYIWSGLLN